MLVAWDGGGRRGGGQGQGGHVDHLVGSGAALGNEIRDGFNLALQHTGGKLGGLPAEVVVADDQQKADAGRQAVERLLKRDKVDVMTGIVFSNAAAGDARHPAIGHDLPQHQHRPENYAAGCNPNFFAVAWQNEDIPAAIARGRPGLQRVALIARLSRRARIAQRLQAPVQGRPVRRDHTQLGQLDYGVEITACAPASRTRCSSFLPGGMGVNFIKQFNGAGLGQEIAAGAGFLGRRGHHRRRGRADQGTTPRNGRRTWTIPPTASSSRISRRPSACRRCTPAGLRRRHAAGQRGAPDRRQLDADTLRPALPRRFQVGARRFQVQPQPVSHPELLPADHRGWRGRQAGEQARARC